MRSTPDILLLVLVLIAPVVAAVLVHLSRREKHRADVISEQLSAATNRAHVLADLGARRGVLHRLHAVAGRGRADPGIRVRLGYGGCRRTPRAHRYRHPGRLRP